MSQTQRVSVCASVRARERASLSLCVGYCAVPAVLLPGWLGLAWLVPVPVCSVRRSVAKLLYTYFFRVFFSVSSAQQQQQKLAVNREVPEEEKSTNNKNNNNSSNKTNH